MDVTPCKGCEKRYIGCHGSCLDYHEWKTRREESNKRRREYHDANRFMNEVQKRGAKRWKKS